MREFFSSLGRRLPVILPLLALGFWLMLKAAGGQGGMFGVLGWFLLGTACLATTAILLAYPIAEFLSLPFGDLYMPRTEVIPPPLYHLVEKLEKEGRWDEAMVEYTKILHYHPKEFIAHTGRMRLAARVYRDWKLASECCLKARTALQGTGFEPELERIWFELQEKSASS